MSAETVRLAETPKEKRAANALSIAGFTIVPQAQLAFAKVLAQSFRAHHPQSTFTIFIADKRTANRDEIDDGIRGLSQAGVSATEARSWPLLYSTEQLVGKIREQILRHSAQLEAAQITAIFAPKIQVFGPLEKLPATIDARQTFVAADKDQPPDAAEIFAFATSSSPAESQVELGNFDDPNLLLGHWNFDGMAFRWLRDHYEFRGAPIASFSFAGYDVEQPHLFSRHQGLAPRWLLSEWPVLQKICDEYRQRVIVAGYFETKNRGSDFAAMPSGMPIDPLVRRLYREEYERFAKNEGPEPPSPFASDDDAEFLTWLREPLTKDGTSINRYMMTVYAARPDVRQAFPDPLGANAKSFRDWIFAFGRNELELTESLLSADGSLEISKAAALETIAPQSVSVAGYLRAELGMGEAARLLVAALETTDIPFDTVSYRRTASRQSHPFEDRKSGAANADINIICVNADQIPAFAEAVGSEYLHGRYTIGMWAWEVEDFPAEFHAGFNYVDEIWVVSEFIRASLAKVSPKPVYNFHLPVIKPEIDPTISRADLRLPNEFIFLFSFDFLSVLERKNPLGLIDAFVRAFAPGEGPQLVIKTINGDKRLLEMEKLKYAARRHPQIQLFDGYLSPPEKNALMAHCDCYASLHRSEGFGLTMAEAMALAKPVIATGYSGNLEFMTPENSYLCAFQKTKVGPSREPYPADSTWSEPDLDDAARLLRHVYENQDEARDRGARAARDVAQFHSPTVAGKNIRQRIETIRRRRMENRIEHATALRDQLEALEAENILLRRELEKLRAINGA